MSDQVTPGTWGEPVPPQDTPPELRRRRPLNQPEGGTGRTATVPRDPGPRTGAATRPPASRGGIDQRGRTARRQRRRVHIVERFSGRRVRPHVSVWRKTRSIVYLVIIGAILAAATAAILAAIVAGIAVGLHHLSKGG